MKKIRGWYDFKNLEIENYIFTASRRNGKIRLYTSKWELLEEWSIFNWIGTIVFLIVDKYGIEIEIDKEYLEKKKKYISSMDDMIGLETNTDLKIYDYRDRVEIHLFGKGAIGHFLRRCEEKDIIYMVDYLKRLGFNVEYKEGK